MPSIWRWLTPWLTLTGEYGDGSPVSKPTCSSMRIGREGLSESSDWMRKWNGVVEDASK